MRKETVPSTKNRMKPSNPTSSLHPPYFDMISEAILTMKDRTGSSQQAIAKFIEEKYEKVLPPNFKKLLSVQLKKFVKSERLVKVKNSFKISSTEKLKLSVNETKKNKEIVTENPPKGKENGADKKVAEKGVKTKRLSQVKTPEVLKRTVKEKKKSMGVGERIKKLSQIKTPDVFKKKELTPMKTKNKRMGNSSRPVKKGKK